MADDKTKRGSPDNKRLNKSEPYEVAYAQRKAAGKTGAAAKKNASGSAAGKSRAASDGSSAGKSRAASGGGRAKSADGSTPRPTARAERAAKGAEKNPANTAPALKRESDAIDLLVEDHLIVDACFKKYKKLMKAEASAQDRQMLANTVCTMLKAHTAIEEEIFYPAARAAGIESDMMDEADIEHAAAKDLIAQIEAGTPDSDHYDAKVTVLGEYIEHHVVEEHTEMFPQCRRAGMDLVALRAQMEARKAELLGGESA